MVGRAPPFLLVVGPFWMRVGKEQCVTRGGETVGAGTLPRASTATSVARGGD